MLSVGLPVSHTARPHQERPPVNNEVLRKWLFRLAPTALVLVLALAVCEVVLRLGGGPPASVTALRDYDRSARLAWPDEERLHPWAAGASNVLKIAVIGDSFTTGQNVAHDDTFPSRLERLANLRAGARPVVVRAWARGGTETAVQTQFLGPALEWKPDALILSIYLNDTEDTKNWKELTVWRERMMPRVPGRVTAALMRRLRTVAWIYLRLEQARCRREFANYYAFLYRDDYSGWLRFVQALHTFREACDKSGCRLLAVVWPNLTELDPKRYPFHFAHEKIGAALKKEGIETLDLRPVFLGRNPVRMQVMPGVDGHPTEIAYRMGAETMFGAMLANGILPQTHVPKNNPNAIRPGWERIFVRMTHPESFTASNAVQAAVLKADDR